MLCVNKKKQWFLFITLKKESCKCNYHHIIWYEICIEHWKAHFCWCLLEPNRSAKLFKGLIVSKGPLCDPVIITIISHIFILSQKQIPNFKSKGSRMMKNSKMNMKILKKCSICDLNLQARKHDKKPWVTQNSSTNTIQYKKNVFALIFQSHCFTYIFPQYRRNKGQVCCFPIHFLKT